MESTQLTCPHCGSALNFGTKIASGTQVECLICMGTFAANPGEATAPRPKPVAEAVSTSAANTSAPKSVAREPSAPAKTTKPAPPQKPAAPGPVPAGPPQESKAVLLAVTFGLLLLLCGGIGVAVWKLSDTGKDGGTADPGPQLAANTKDGSEKKTGAATNKTEKPDPQKENPAKKTSEDDDDLKGKKPKDDPNPVLKRKDPPKVQEKEPEIGDIGPVTKIDIPKKAIPGVDQEKINQAIDKGVAFLKKTQKADGSWREFNFPVGVVSLAGLTLLECKTPANDPSVERAAAYVRNRAAGLDKNYDASATLLFLDRLGDKRDRPLIQALALRLLAGQLQDGGWDYTCAVLQQQEMQQLLAFLQSHKQPNANKPIRAETLSPNLRGMHVVQNQGKLKGKHALRISRSDNSNTQFVLLALWAARRHDVPVDQALLAAFDRFILTQSRDGGWSYEVRRTDGVMPPPIIPGKGPLRPGFAPELPGDPLAATSTSSPAMTCVGLLGLAMGHGVAPDIVGNNADNPKQPIVKPALQDERIKKGLEALARDIGQPVAAGNLPSLPRENLYFLWSVERVAMLYNVDTIGGKDWYAWGAQGLVSQQNIDGQWSSVIYAGSDATVDTCFALLFLRRSNLVADLTVNLRLRSAIRDPEK